MAPVTVEEASLFFKGLQDRIVRELEAADGKSFNEELWDRPDGGGGRTRVLPHGNLFEEAWVDLSLVDGSMLAEIFKEGPGAGVDCHCWQDGQRGVRWRVRGGVGMGSGHGRSPRGSMARRHGDR